MAGMPPGTMEAIAATVTGVTQAGFAYGQAQLAAQTAMHQATLGQTVDLSATGWQGIAQLNSNAGLQQAIANKYAQPRTSLFSTTPNWLPWALGGAAALLVVFIVFKK